MTLTDQSAPARPANSTRPAPQITVALPALGRPTRLKLPASAERTLANGLTVIAVRRPVVPLVELRLRLPFARAPLARAQTLAAALFTGTAERSAVELAAALQAERVAVLYRRIVLLVGAQLLSSCFGQVLAGGAQGSDVLILITSMLTLLATLAIGVLSAVAAYQLMREMGSSVPWLWAIALFVPCVNIITLLVVSARATSWCKERGIKVGLLGPTKESIERLKREASVDRVFE